ADGTVRHQRDGELVRAPPHLIQKAPGPALQEAAQTHPSGMLDADQDTATLRHGTLGHPRAHRSIPESSATCPRQYQRTSQTTRVIRGILLWHLTLFARNPRPPPGSGRKSTPCRRLTRPTTTSSQSNGATNSTPAR